MPGVDRYVLDLSAGGVIFRDTFDQYGAGAGYLNTAAWLLLGRRLLAVKYAVCVWYAFIAVALFVLARQWLARVLAGERLPYSGVISGPLEAKGDLKAKGATGFQANARLSITPGHRGVPVSTTRLADGGRPGHGLRRRAGRPPPLDHQHRGGLTRGGR